MNRLNKGYNRYETQVILDCVAAFPKKSTAFREAANKLPGRSKAGIANYYSRELKDKTREEAIANSKFTKDSNESKEEEVVPTTTVQVRKLHIKAPEKPVSSPDKLEITKRLALKLSVENRQELIDYLFDTL